MPTNPDERNLKSLTAVAHLYCQFSTISLRLKCHAHETSIVMKHIANKNVLYIARVVWNNL